MKKRVTISVISDLATDQRVHRAAIALHDSGYEVLVIGRKLRASLNLPALPYSTKRFKLLFEKGPLFYASFNLRLFFFLLTNKADILLSNDLDTLLPNFLISKLKNKKLVYDSHELFTEVPELVSRPLIQNVWKTLEGYLLPRLKNMYTVNTSIANIYNERYNINPKVIRNIPLAYEPITQSKTELRQTLGLPTDKTIFILQGAGINIDRGAEEAVDAIEKVAGGLLLIVGSGDVIEDLKRKVEKLVIGHKVIFQNKKPVVELRLYTTASDVGLSLDKDTNLNYRYSLPNKLFDYLHAGIPVIASNLPEVANIIDQYKVGLITKADNSTAIANCMNEMIIQKDEYNQWQLNTLIAAKELNWQKEKLILLNIFSTLE